MLINSLINDTLQPWHKFRFVIVHDPFHVLLNLFANILLRIFVSVFIRDIGL